MSNDEWWDVARKAAEYWHQVAANRTGPVGKGAGAPAYGDKADSAKSLTEGGRNERDEHGA